MWKYRKMFADETTTSICGTERHDTAINTLEVS